MAIEDWEERLANHAKHNDFRPACRRFYFLRHGQTDHNRKRICQGHTDVPLNQTGLMQADIAASVLASIRPKAIRSSDLARVRQTAAPVSQQLNLDVEADQRLRERFFGVYENKPIEGKLWAYDHPSVESIEAFVDRSLAGFDWALDQDDVLVVTHGGLRRVLAGALDLKMSDWTAHNALPTRYSLDDDGHWHAEILTRSGAWPADGPEPSDLDR